MKTIISKLVLALALVASNFAFSKVDFEKQILPIFDQHCFSCHYHPTKRDNGRIKHPKGKLNMMSKEGLLKGGRGDLGTGKSIVPGKAKESSIYTLIILPATHVDVMPTEDGDGPVPAKEAELIKQWINEGANFGSWTSSKSKK